MHHIQRDILRIKTFMELLLGGEKENGGRASLAILAMVSRAWLVGYGRASDGRDRSCLIHSDAAAEEDAVVSRAVKYPA